MVNIIMGDSKPEIKNSKGVSRGLHLSSLTLQQLIVGLLGLAFSVVIFRQTALPDTVIVDKLQLILIVCAVGTMIQATANRYLGSGDFLPPLSGAIYVQPSILAISIGGIPLLIGMTLFAGLCEFLLSFVIRKTRFFFPPEICGLVVLLVGLELAVVSFRAGVQPDYFANLVIFIATLLPIIVLSVWGKGYVRHICSFVGILFGAVAAMFVSPDAIAKQTQALVQAPFFAFPNLSAIWHQTIVFDWTLALPFFLVAFAASLRTMGLHITLQQFNDPKWRYPNYQKINRALRADGLTAMLAGLLGLNGLNVSPTATTLAIASRYTKKTLAYTLGSGLILLALFPKLLTLIASAPLSIVSAILLYYAAFIFSVGIRTIGAQTFGIRQVFVIGISFSLAISTLIYPELFQQLPYPINVFGRSAISMGLVTAVILNLFFHIGTFRRGSFILRLENKPDQVIRDKFYEYGESWHMTHDLVEDAIMIGREISTQIHHAKLTESDILVEVAQSTTKFTLTFTYYGVPYKMTSSQPLTADNVLDEEMFISGLKNHLRGIYPDEVRTQVVGDECKLMLTFHHI